MLDRAICIYLGRKPDFLTEVILWDEGDGAYIKEWNATDKPKPKEADVLKLYANATYESQFPKEKSIYERVDELEGK